jgi:pimeloyl-ACP methyl ester carboxylesterase
VQVRIPRAVLDVVAALTLVPLIYAVRTGVRAAWLVLHPPRRPVRQKPDSFGLVAERVTVGGADGVPLACWFVPGTPGRDAVVLSHGIGRDSGMLMSLVKEVHDAGYHALTFDLRNHGDSGADGRLRGQSGCFSTDHLNVVRYLAARPELAGRRIACLAFSISAWTALEAARVRPDLVRAVICDSAPQLDVRGGMRRSFELTRGRLPRLLQGPVMFRVTRAAFMRAIVFFLRPEPWPMELGDHSIRLLFVSGAQDPIARPEDMAKQMEWYPRGEHWLVPGMGHMQAHLRAADEYAARVRAVLADAFDRTTEPAGGESTPR